MCTGIVPKLRPMLRIDSHGVRKHIIANKLASRIDSAPETTMFSEQANSNKKTLRKAAMPVFTIHARQSDWGSAAY